MEYQHLQRPSRVETLRKEFTLPLSTWDCEGEMHICTVNSKRRMKFKKEHSFPSPLPPPLWFYTCYSHLALRRSFSIAFKLSLHPFILDKDLTLSMLNSLATSDCTSNGPTRFQNWVNDTSFTPLQWTCLILWATVYRHAHV